MTIEYKQSLTELNTIIHYMDNAYLSKLPQKFIEFVNKNMDINYTPNISKDVPIHKQELKKDTKVLLSLLYRNYWCDDDEKQSLLKEDLIAKKEYEKELYEKYNPDNPFKNKQTLKEEYPNETHTELIEYTKQKWYQKLFAKILKIFKR